MNLKQTDSKPYPSCPQPTMLKEFLQGLLEPPELDDCRSHVADCQSCHETLRGLNSDDTLSHYVAQAFQAKQESPPRSQSDSQQVTGLIGKLLHPKATAGVAIGVGAKAEMLADRAAEVLRYLDPLDADSDEKGLGKLENYLLVRLIGAGSTGVVFHAIDQTLNRNVALKVLRPSLGSVARERFIAEAKLAASIEHANVVTIYQVGSKDRLAYIAMQWLPGQTLEQRLLESELAHDEIRRIVSQVAAGLSAAHQTQLVHRDIKPANIWICENTGEVKILDFGLARIADDDPGLTATGMLAGTPNFMSPEQARGLELDGRSDLFSLGCILYRLLTGRLPFGAPTVLATLQSIQNEHPESPQLVQNDAPADLSDLTMCLLEKQPNNRPDSANQLAKMLERPRDQWPSKVASYTGAGRAGVAAVRSSNTLPADPNSAPDSTAPTQKATSTKAFGGYWIRWATLASLALIGFTGYLLAPQIVRIATDQGEIVVDSNDEDVSIRVSKDGKLVKILDTTTNNSFNIAAGQYEVEAVENSDGENSFEVSPGSFSMKRGQTTIVTVSQTPNASPTVASDGQVEKTRSQRVAGRGRGLDVNAQPNPDSADQLRAIYNGRTFKQWLDIANRDRDPKTSGDAMVACSHLADDPSFDLGQFRSVIQKHVRKWGSHRFGLEDQAAAMHDKLVKALKSMKPEFVVDFAVEELKAGNTRSRGFCVWLTVPAHIYSFDSEGIENHQEAIIRSAQSLLTAAIQMDGEDQIKRIIIGTIGDCVTFRSSGLKPKESLEKLDHLNPKLRPWIKEQYESCSPNSPNKRPLGHLAAICFADDKDFLAEQIRQLFAPQTLPAQRDVTFEIVCGPRPFGGGQNRYPRWDINADHQMIIVLLLLENQFPQPDNEELHRWIESILVDLPAGYSISNLRSDTRVKFEKLEKLAYDEKGAWDPSSWSPSSGFGGGGGGLGGSFRFTPPTPEKLKQARGAPAVIRHLTTHLIETQSRLTSLNIEHKEDLISKFLKKWISINEPEFERAELKALQIGSDIGEFVRILGGQPNRNFSPFIGRRQFGGGGIF